MRRAVERFLEDPLAEELLRGNIKPGETVDVHAEVDKLVFRAVQPEQGEPATAS
jgi:ATP-dependent Clp protease ATP-binding subunit ClpC